MTSAQSAVLVQVRATLADTAARSRYSPTDLEWVAPRPVVPEPGIRLRVYGARVVHTDAATHVAFGQFRRNPNATPCTCQVCSGLDQAVKNWAFFREPR